MNGIRRELLSKKDEKYQKFHAKRVPDTAYEIIGVRVPEVKKTVKSVKSTEEIYSFIKSEHRYYEEYLAHGLLLGKIKDENETYKLLEEFLPLIDNWAICDTTVSALKNLTKNKELLLEKVLKWIKSEKTYTVRFAFVCILNYFTDKEYTDLIETVSKVEFSKVSSYGLIEYPEIVNLATHTVYLVLKKLFCSCKSCRFAVSEIIG